MFGLCGVGFVLCCVFLGFVWIFWFPPAHIVLLASTNTTRHSHKFDKVQLGPTPSDTWGMTEYRLHDSLQGAFLLFSFAIGPLF